MTDLVGTCPKTFWREWIAEGDPAGAAWSGTEWGWYTRDRLADRIEPGDRFYVVAHGRLRGWSPVTAVRKSAGGGWIICRRGDAVAVTLPGLIIPGFRGLRTRWWRREAEVAFPEWQTEGVAA